MHAALIWVCITQLKHGSSSIPRVISVELLNFAPEIILEMLTPIFNKCILQEEMTNEEWQMETGLTYIYKKVCVNLRGIR